MSGAYGGVADFEAVDDVVGLREGDGFADGVVEVSEGREFFLNPGPSPGWRGGRCAGGEGSGAEVDDLSQYFISIVEDFVVPESDDANAVFA